MDNNCLFCKIILDKVKCHKLYENESALAFMDKRPINPGHLLVIPKKHVADFYDLELRGYCEVMLVAKFLAKIVNSLTKPKKVGLAIAGFDISHVHVHIIPMHHYHDLTSKSLMENMLTDSPDRDLAEMANIIRAKIDES